MKRVALAAVVAACSANELDVPRPQAGSSEIRDAGVRADAAEQRLIGVLTVSESVDIAPRVAGVVKAILVNVGDGVAANQVVAEMDPIQLRDEVRAAEAAANAASAAVSSAAVDVDDARRKIVLETRAVKDGISAKEVLEEAKMNLRRAEAALQRARSTLTAEASRAKTAKDHLSDAGLRAPFAGTVAVRFRDAGGRIDAGGAIMRIVGRGNMRLRFAVSPERSRRAKPGGRITATVDTIAKPVTATIKTVATNVDAASGMIFVEAELAEGNEDLRSGLAAWVDPLPELPERSDPPP